MFCHSKALVVCGRNLPRNPVKYRADFGVFLALGSFGCLGRCLYAFLGIAGALPCSEESDYHVDFAEPLRCGKLSF